MKFYNQVLRRSLEITQSKPFELRLLMSDKYQFPSLESDRYGRVLRVPKPVRTSDGFMLDGIIFEDNELGRTLLMKTLMSSVEHLSVHSVISDFSLYNKWLKGKDPKIAIFAADLIEDLSVKVYARSRLKGLLQNMALANAVSYAVMNPPERVKSTQYLLQSALLSYFIAGRYRFLLPSSVKKDVLSVLASLHSFEKVISERERKLNPWWTDNEVKRVKLKSADSVYTRLAKYGTTKEVAYLPYTDTHAQVERINEELTLQIGQSINVVADTFRTLGLQLTSDASIEALLGKAFREEASILLYDMASEERWKKNTLRHYTKLAANTEFDNLLFPEEDFAEYARSYAKYAGSIRKIIEQVRLFKNHLSTNTDQEAGELDMQKVIQQLASRSNPDKIFIREEYNNKSEAWGILLDASGSIKPFSATAKHMALCLAEIANELITEKKGWGLYAFNNRFTVVKDLMEDYTQNVKARIGGLDQGGLSYIPDALHLTSQILGSAGMEHNYLFIISDGLPSGYPNIDAKLERTIKEISRAGIAIISVSVGSSHLQKYIRGTSLKVESVHDLMTKFVNMYISLGNEL
jgi:hypothetical protein